VESRKGKGGGLVRRLVFILCVISVLHLCFPYLPVSPSRRDEEWGFLTLLRHRF
jgi:hypothetical protein